MAAWRRAEARVYPTVMVDAAMYEQYLTMVRAVADELADVRTEDELVTAWEERRELASASSRATRPRCAPSWTSRRCATRPSAIATATSRARGARRSRASASSRHGATGPSGSCSSTT